MVTEPRHQVLRRASTRVLARIQTSNDRGGLEMAFERFETLADLFLRYLCQGDDFLERTRYFGLATSDEDAGGDDGVEGFPTQEFFVVRALEKLLGEVCDRLGKADVVAHVGDEMEGVLEGLFACLLGDLVRGPLKLPRHPSVTVAEGDDRLEVVGAIEERVGRSTHTRRIVAFVVGKRTPCSSNGRTRKRGK